MEENNNKREKPSTEVLFNRQVNYMIIEKMWKYIHKKEDIQNLYELLDIDKNAYSRIRNADTFQGVDLEKRWNKKDSRISATGLSKEIMTGKDMIEIEGVTREEWKQYLDYRYDESKKVKRHSADSNYSDDEKRKISIRTSSMQYFNKKLNTVFENLTANKRDKRDIAKLYYFFKYGRSVDLDMPDREMVDLKDSLNQVDVEKMKLCDMELKKEVYALLKEKYEQLRIIVEYNSL